MFKEWDFLLAEIWGLLALAALLGLVAGWLIWGGRRVITDFEEQERLRIELARAKAAARKAAELDDIPPMQGGGYVRPAAKPEPTPVAAPAVTSPAQTPPAADMTSTPPTDPMTEPAPKTDPPKTPTETSKTEKPKGLSAPRDGLPDDLTKIKGVGAKLEKLCNDLGFWHYEQIAAWTTDDVAWMDENLEGFKGRVTRDAWVEQAKALAKNETPAFVRRT